MRQRPAVRNTSMRGENLRGTRFRASAKQRSITRMAMLAAPSVPSAFTPGVTWIVTRPADPDYRAAHAWSFQGMSWMETVAAAIPKRGWVGRHPRGTPSSQAARQCLGLNLGLRRCDVA